MDVISDFPVDLKLVADKTKAHWMKKKKKKVYWFLSWWYLSLCSQQWYSGLFWPVSIASASSQPLSLSVQMSLLPSDEAAAMSLYVNGPETLASLKSLVTCTRSDSQVWAEKTGGEKERTHMRRPSTLTYNLQEDVTVTATAAVARTL